MLADTIVAHIHPAWFSFDAVTGAGGEAFTHCGGCALLRDRGHIHNDGVVIERCRTAFDPMRWKLEFRMFFPEFLLHLPQLFLLLIVQLIFPDVAFQCFGKSSFEQALEAGGGADLIIPFLKKFSEKWGLQPMQWTPSGKLNKDEGSHYQLPRTLRIKIYKEISQIGEEIKLH